MFRSTRSSASGGMLVCTAIYAIPQTAVLGAILLTGFLGGLLRFHVRAGSDAFPITFSIGFGVLAWVGLNLRAPDALDDTPAAVTRSTAQRTPNP